MTWHRRLLRWQPKCQQSSYQRMTQQKVVHSSRGHLESMSILLKGVVAGVSELNVCVRCHNAWCSLECSSVCSLCTASFCSKFYIVCLIGSSVDYVGLISYGSALLALLLHAMRNTCLSAWCCHTPASSIVTLRPMLLFCSVVRAPASGFRRAHLNNHTFACSCCACWWVAGVTLVCVQLTHGTMCMLPELCSGQSNCCYTTVRT